MMAKSRSRKESELENVITSGFDQLRPGALVDVHHVQAQNAPAKGTPRLNSEHKTGERR